jgi:hypothetical protein
MIVVIEINNLSASLLVKANWIAGTIRANHSVTVKLGWLMPNDRHSLQCAALWRPETKEWSGIFWQTNLD